MNDLQPRPRQRIDEFIYQLKVLQYNFQEYEEYVNLLQLLIDRIEEGKVAKIELALKEMMNEEEHW